MKSKHRHDLETNELARHLAEWIEKLKPHTNILVLVVGILAGLMLINSIWSAAAASKERAAWDAFALATRTSDRELMQLQRVAEEYPDTAMHDWAYATWADRQMQIASGAYLIDREAALDRMRRVMGIYEGLAAGDTDLLIRDRAHMGLARIYEMQDKLEESRRHYRQVQGDMASLASQRADQLESSEVQTACQWLATAELPKQTLPQGPGVPGVRPDFGVTLPEAGEGVGPEGLKSIEELLGEAMTSDSSGGGQEDRYGPSAGEGDDAGEKSSEEKPDESAVEEPVAQEPAIEEPAAEEPATEEPAAEEPAAEEPAAEEPAAEEPAAEEPAAEEPAAEEPAAEEPAAEEPAAEEPTADEPTAEEPAAEKPMVEEPSAS